MTARRQHWETAWSGKGESEMSWFQAHPETSLALIERAGVAPAAPLIDIGGGASRLVDALLLRGHGDVSVLDLAAPALDTARARLGEERAAAVSWIVADVTRWTPPRRYALWHDRAVFHFLTETEDRDRYVAALAAALAPGGQAILATFALDGPERCSGLPVRRYDAAGLAAALGGGFRLVESLTEAHRTPGGGRQSFQYARFVRT